MQLLGRDLQNNHLSSGIHYANALTAVIIFIGMPSRCYNVSWFNLELNKQNLSSADRFQETIEKS